MKKAIFNSAAVIAGIALGVVVGNLLFLTGLYEVKNPYRYFNWIGISWGISEDAFEKNSGDAKVLLQKNLVLLENGVDSRSDLDPSMKKALLLQAAFTKARLSILEKNSGSQDQAKSYMSAAQADLKSLGWRDYSAAHIEQAVQPHRATSTGTPSVKPASAQLPGAQTK